MSYSFKHNNVNRCIYSKFTKSDGVIVSLYVDDLLIFGTSMENIKETKKHMSSQFKMKDLGEVDTILDIKVMKYIGGYALC